MTTTEAAEAARRIDHAHHRAWPDVCDPVRTTARQLPPTVVQAEHLRGDWNERAPAHPSLRHPTRVHATSPTGDPQLRAIYVRSQQACEDIVARLAAAGLTRGGSWELSDVNRDTPVHPDALAWTMVSGAFARSGEADTHGRIILTVTADIVMRTHRTWPRWHLGLPPRERELRLCGNCGADEVRARNRCAACYEWLARTGHERPASRWHEWTAPGP